MALAFGEVELWMFWWEFEIWWGGEHKIHRETSHRRCRGPGDLRSREQPAQVRSWSYLELHARSTLLILWWRLSEASRMICQVCPAAMIGCIPLGDIVVRSVNSLAAAQAGIGLAGHAGQWRAQLEAGSLTEPHDRTSSYFAVSMKAAKAKRRSNEVTVDALLYPSRLADLRTGPTGAETGKSNLTDANSGKENLFGDELGDVGTTSAKSREKAL
eukprot:6207138-Pleurochrysis_carterae.AAC.1